MKPTQLPKGMRVGVTGARGFLGRHLLDALRSQPVALVYLDDDVRSSDSPKQDFDVLYHLASVLSARFTEDPELDFPVNVDGTLRMLEACRNRGARLIFPSISGIYNQTRILFPKQTQRIHSQTTRQASIWQRCSFVPTHFITAFRALS